MYRIAGAALRSTYSAAQQQRMRRLNTQQPCGRCTTAAAQHPRRSTHLVQDHAANHLHVKGAQAQHPLGRLTHHLHNTAAKENAGVGAHAAL